MCALYLLSYRFMLCVTSFLLLLPACSEQQCSFQRHQPNPLIIFPDIGKSLSLQCTSQSRSRTNGSHWSLANLMSFSFIHFQDPGQRFFATKLDSECEISQHPHRLKSEFGYTEQAVIRTCEKIEFSFNNDSREFIQCTKASAYQHI